MPFTLKVNVFHAPLSEQRDHIICRHPDCEWSDASASKREVCLLLRRAGTVAGKQNRQCQREKTMERKCAKALDAIARRTLHHYREE